MAEVIANELGSSNGEVSEENDDIKLNGDSCDDFSSADKNSPQLNDSQISKDKYLTKKIPGQEVHGVEKAYEQAQLNEKNCNISVANGRVKPPPSSVHDNDGNGDVNDDDDDDDDNDDADANAELGDKAERPDCGPSLAEQPSSICTEEYKTELGDSDKHSDDDDIESEKNIVNDAHCDSNKADSAAGRSDAKTTECARVQNDDEPSSAIVEKCDSSSVEKRIFTALKDSISISISTCGSRDRNSGNANEVVVDVYTRDGYASSELHTASGAASRTPSLANDASTGEKKSSDEDDNETRNHHHHHHHHHHNDKNSDNNNEDDNDEVISISSTPDKAKKIGKKPSLSMTHITPRRSSRNLNKQKSYAEKDNDFEENALAAGKKRSAGGEDDEIEEVTPTDPLADEPKSKMRNKTIVVSDTKGLVEFASNAKASRSNKKEPTLVIIDTNSILSGRGPIPVSQQSSASSLLHSSSSSAPIPVSLPIPAGAFASATRGASPSSTSAFSVIPIGLPAQGMYSQFKNPPPQIKPIVVGPASTTVTAVPLSTTANSASATTITTVSATSSTTVKQPPVILPSLTDDMFVVEAPSFIVPYVYEKPPMKSLKEHIEKIQTDIKEAEDDQRKQQEEKERVENEKNAEEAKNAQVDGNDAETDDAEQDTAADVAATSEEKEEGVTVEKVTADSPMEVDSEAVESNAAAVTTDVVSAGVGTNAVVKKTDTDKKDESQSGGAKEIEKKTTAVTDDSKKPISYFDNPLGKFFMQIGLNLVQEHVQTDLLRSQKRKRDKEGSKCSQDVHSAIDELTKTLESSKENNDPFKLELKKCELCSFKTESLLVMAHHLETPHMKNYTYRCNFCPLEVRSPHDILFHMEAEHNIRGRLERAPAFHQCPNCPFEDNQKGKLTRHLISCSKKYRPERNQEPPLDWEPPAKIPRVTRNRPPSMSPGNAVYQAAMSGLKQVPQNTLLPKLMPNTTNMKHTMLSANKRPNIGASLVNRFPNAGNQPNFQQRPISVQTSNQGMMFRTGGGTNSQTQVLLPQGYQLSGAQIYQQNQSTKSQSQQQSLAAAKLLNQPSISITPLPRQTSTQASTSANSAATSNLKPGKPVNSSGGKNTFVVCEICDGYIKDLEQLRNHMQWIHKVKIHPKMIYNRPPLNCQKCQFRFFTDQGLERHLLGSHGLVTSSMQEAANKGKDGGRCPVCGRVYQWKLLNHVARDHQMALKPAHLSYKCTVCTATFGMYKQFESHVYSAHSVVAKRAMDTTKKPPSSQTTSSQNDTLLKPLKINDEITIIPQPVRTTKLASKSANATTITATLTSSKGKNDEDEQSCKRMCSMEDFSSNEEFQRHVCEQHLKPFKIRISRIDLKSYNKIPNKENAFKLTRGTIIADELRSKFDLKDFYIEIKRHSVNVDFRYKIVSNDEIDAMHSMPELVYSDVDENDTETRKNRTSLESNTLFAKRLMQRYQMSSATRTARKPKRRIPNGCINVKRPTKTSIANSSSSSSDVDIVEESSSANNDVFDQFNESTHFLLGSARNLTPMISSQNRSSISTSSVRQTAHQLICVSRTVTTSQTSNVPSPHQHLNVSTGKSSLTVINKQMVTTSSSMTFGRIGPRPTALPRANVQTTNAFNPVFSSNRPILGHSNATSNGGALFCRQRSTKITHRITSFAKPTPSTVSSNGQNDVISLLSDSDSDDGVVEIIETGNDTNDSNDVYILPT